ncbi:unnamed protein product, partial [Staurois parvus]
RCDPVPWEIISAKCYGKRIGVNLGFHTPRDQGRTDNSWGPRTIGDHGTPVSLPKLKKANEKVPGASQGAPY